MLSYEGVGEVAKIFGSAVLAEMRIVFVDGVGLVQEIAEKAEQEHHAVHNGVSLPYPLPQFPEEMDEGQLAGDFRTPLFGFIGVHIGII